MDFALLEILFIVLGFQLVFVAFFLLQSNKGKPLSNKILAIIFLMLSVAVINIYRMLFKISSVVPELNFIDDTFMLAYGPLFYLFTQSVVFKRYKLSKIIILHFVPFFIFLAYVLWVIIFVDTKEQIQAIQQMENLNIPWYIQVVGLFLLSHILIYLIKSKLIMKKVLFSAFENYSNINKENYSRLNFILNSFIALFLLSLLNSILPFFGIKKGLLVSLLMMILFMFYFINSILFKMLKGSTDNSGLISETKLIAKEKYAGSNLSKQQVVDYNSKLLDHMINNKRYLDSELTVDQLAKELNLSSKAISQVINERQSCNFFDFVNKFRVDEVKLKFQTLVDDKTTILEIMYESGFNSKSSFNTAFKKFTKLTPTQYKNSLTS